MELQTKLVEIPRKIVRGTCRRRVYIPRFFKKRGIILGCT